MIVYLDSSALVKCYGDEAGSLDTVDLLGGAELVATSLVTSVEVSSALARAVRGGIVEPEAGREADRLFREEWPALIRLPLTPRVLGRAQDIAWELALRGYDAVQLASALIWQERVGTSITLATFDARLARAARDAGMAVWPSPA